MKRIGAVLLFFLASGAALAQDYPARPVGTGGRGAAGGPTDTLTRVLAGSMGEALKQQMIVENAGGAGGTIGVTRAAKARADGSALLLYHIGMATAPTLYRKLQYDTLNDFDYVGQVADVPMMLIAKKATDRKSTRLNSSHRPHSSPLSPPPPHPHSPPDPVPQAPQPPPQRLRLRRAGGRRADDADREEGH